MFYVRKIIYIYFPIKKYKVNFNILIKHLNQQLNTDPQQTTKIKSKVLTLWNFRFKSYVQVDI